MNQVVILLGSNIDKERNLPRAARLLARLCHVAQVSPVYETAPVGRRDQPPFLNVALLLHTDLDAATLKTGVLARIESKLDRVRTADPNAPRTIDADIILYNGQVFEYTGRRVPDPDLARYPHVAVPVADLVPDLPHPQTGEPLRTLAARLRREAETARGAAVLWPRPDVDAVIARLPGLGPESPQ